MNYYAILIFPLYVLSADMQSEALLLLNNFYQEISGKHNAFYELYDLIFIFSNSTGNLQNSLVLLLNNTHTNSTSLHYIVLENSSPNSTELIMHVSPIFNTLESDKKYLTEALFSFFDASELHFDILVPPKRQDFKNNENLSESVKNLAFINAVISYKNKTFSANLLIDKNRIIKKDFWEIPPINETITYFYKPTSNPITFFVVFTIVITAALSYASMFLYCKYRNALLGILNYKEEQVLSLNQPKEIA
ncbi:unnamed protein product [Blepharisma stoltei]|uniref:Uncharacterized protein n=1 Tax=Blepharisma stoltei TaxID=1481888 RepID=A0AAU9IL66_9CILI|nr:unnamed protein product [Blepharisma stoltei]